MRISDYVAIVYIIHFIAMSLANKILTVKYVNQRLKIITPIIISHTKQRIGENRN